MHQVMFAVPDAAGLQYIEQKKLSVNHNMIGFTVSTCMAC